VGGVTTQYFYNADSARVKKVVGSTTTYYVGNWYEVTNGAATKYYYFGAQCVAMRNANGVTYLHGDHLGSTSVTSGAQPSSQTYYAFGKVRSGSLPTDYTFTGQKRDADADLMFYNARYYDPGIGRFVQADPIVAAPFNPQLLNRYAYVLNNPVRYTDPTGHAEQDLGGGNTLGTPCHTVGDCTYRIDPPTREGGGFHVILVGKKFFDDYCKTAAGCYKPRIPTKDPCKEHGCVKPLYGKIFPWDFYTRRSNTKILAPLMFPDWNELLTLRKHFPRYQMCHPR
jgi:RHS repeat-associated protein